MDYNLALKLNKFIHEQCVDGVPHDIGANVLKIVDEYTAKDESETASIIVVGSILICHTESSEYNIEKGKEYTVAILDLDDDLNIGFHNEIQEIDWVSSYKNSEWHWKKFFNKK